MSTSLGETNCSNKQDSKQPPAKTSLTPQSNEEVSLLDNDYKELFMRRLASDMQTESIPPNDLKRKFGLTKDSLENLLPEYKLLLNRFDISLYRYTLESLTARYLHSQRIDSDTIIQTSSSSHKLVEVEESESPDVAGSRMAAHVQRLQDVEDQRLHKAGRSQLDNVMELIRTEDRPVSAFSEGQGPLSASSEADVDPVSTGDRVEETG